MLQFPIQLIIPNGPCHTDEKEAAEGLLFLFEKSKKRKVQGRTGFGASHKENKLKKSGTEHRHLL